MIRLAILKLNWHLTVRAGLSIFLTAMSPLAFAGNFNGGGGGTDLVFEFKEAARKAIRELPHHTQLQKLPVKKIARKLESANIIVSEQRLFVKIGNIRQEVAALNYRRRNLIVMNRPMWNSITSNLRKEAVALHEVLSLMELEGTGNYTYSQRYFDNNKPKANIRFTDMMKPQVLNTVDNPQVTLIIYEDFLSPFVGYNNEAMQMILQNFRDRVQIIVRNFPITVLNENSHFAALVGISANDQNLFIEYRAKILSISRKKLGVTKDEIQAVANSFPKLDQQALAKCLDSQWPQMKLDADLKVVEETHLTGSPTVTVSSKHQTDSIVGSWPYEQWETHLKKLLSQKEFRAEFPAE